MFWRVLASILLLNTITNDIVGVGWNDTTSVALAIIALLFGISEELTTLRKQKGEPP